MCMPASQDVPRWLSAGEAEQQQLAQDSILACLEDVQCLVEQLQVRGCAWCADTFQLGRHRAVVFAPCCPVLLTVQLSCNCLIQVEVIAGDEGFAAMLPALPQRATSVTVCPCPLAPAQIAAGVREQQLGRGARGLCPPLGGAAAAAGRPAGQGPRGRAGSERWEGQQQQQRQCTSRAAAVEALVAGAAAAAAAAAAVGAAGAAGATTTWAVGAYCPGIGAS